MKTRTYITSFLTMAAAVFAASPILAEGKAQSKVLIDFSVQEVERNGADLIPIKKYGYTFGDWQDKINYLKGRGLLVPYVGGQGGMGGDKQLKLADFNFIELGVVIGNRNEADSFGITLTDGDGTEATWYLPLGGRPKGVPMAFKVNLAKCDKEEKPGKKPGLDKAKVRSWAIKGNWQSTKIEVLLINLAASTE